MKSGKNTKRALLVTSSYVPITIADMHRVRHLAWELPNLGWEVEILVPGAEFQRPEYYEPESAPLFNPEVSHHEVSPADIWLFRLLNMRSIGWRALWPMAKAGNELLTSRKFDVIYISTANFNLFCLGRWWARTYNVPYILDYHDPWVRDKVDYSTTSNRWKRRVSAKLSKWMEQYALQKAAGVVAVSPVYIDELRQRYGTWQCLSPANSEAIPFSGAESDFAAIKNSTNGNRKETIEVVYIGAGGSIMAKSFTTICATLAELKRLEPVLFGRLKIHLWGTYAYWKPGDPKPLQQIAANFGLEDIVEEQPQRITYLRAMELIQECDGLMVLGVDDKAYMPSKLFTYALSGKPLLACFRSGSPPTQIFKQIPELGNVLTFDEAEVSPDVEKVLPMRRFLNSINQRETLDRRHMIADYLAPRMAEKHSALFERVCRSGLAK